MRLSISTMALIFAGLLTGACSGTTVTTTEALRRPPPTTGTVAPATTEPEGNLGAPLVAGGCDVFDPGELGLLTPLMRPLALVESQSDDARLVCNFVGAGEGLDTGVRIEVGLISAFPDGHFTTPGQLESPIEIAGRPGVGTGRGTLRAQLDEDRGVTLAVTIRSISSEARPPRDGEFLAIRDAVAAYLITILN